MLKHAQNRNKLFRDALYRNVSDYNKRNGSVRKLYACCTGATLPHVRIVPHARPINFGLADPMVEFLLARECYPDVASVEFKLATTSVGRPKLLGAGVDKEKLLRSETKYFLYRVALQF